MSREQKKNKTTDIEAYQRVMMRIPDCMPQAESVPAITVFRQFLIWPKSKRKKLTPANLIIDFQRTNQELLDFLDLKISYIGHEKNGKMTYQSSRYVGAIPTVVAGGIQGGDIFIYPRFVKRQPTTEDTTAAVDAQPDSDALTQLTSILLLLDAEIEPEFYPSQPLKNPMALRPPLYYEAIKFLLLYEQALRVQWRKFRSECREYSYPKGSTDWGKYAQRYADPRKQLSFPARDSVLTVNHPEWQEMKYVFELAAQELTSFSAPSTLRIRYSGLIRELEIKTKEIPARKPLVIKEHVADPAIIKELKRQAQMLLERRTNYCTAWRIDVAKVFELFTQHVLREALKLYGWHSGLHANAKFQAKGHLPPWGLKYLEPDMVICHDDVVIIADAKYKPNLITGRLASEVLKETHRHDLHQILAYCSFAPQKNKLAMLVYPHRRVSAQKISYQDPFFRTKNTILLVGIPFDANEVEKTIQEVKEQIFQKYLSPYMEEQSHE